MVRPTASPSPILERMYITAVTCFIAVSDLFSGALRPAEYHAIMKNYPSLVSDMPANQAVDFMFSGRIINHQKTNKIMSPLLTEEDKARMILDSVLRHPKGYATLIEALDSPQCSADWLAERLRKDVEEFERRPADEHT